MKIAALFLLAILSAASHAAHVADFVYQVPSVKTVLASSAKTTTQTVKFTSVPVLKCGHIIVNVTAYTAGSITPKIQGYDPASDSYYDVLVGPAITSTGKTVLKVCPGITAIVNGASADFIPVNWQLVVTAGTADSITYSVGVELIP